MDDTLESCMKVLARTSRIDCRLPLVWIFRNIRPYFGSLRGGHTYHAEQTAGNSCCRDCAKDDQSKEPPGIPACIAAEERVDGGRGHDEPLVMWRSELTVTAHRGTRSCPLNVLAT